MTEPGTVLYIQPVHESGMDFLRERFDVVVAPDTEPATLGRLIADADAVVTRLTLIDGELIDRSPRLKVIGRHGIGLDNIDVELARSRGIEVITTDDANSVSVAEHALMAIGALYKEIPSFDREVRRGNWTVRDRSRARELGGKTLGIVGLGSIGTTLARMAGAGLGMRIRYYDPYAGTATVAAARAAGHHRDTDLDELVRNTDVLSVHVPLTAETRGLIDEHRLALLPRRAVVVNFARGGIVDESALADALRDGVIAAAAVDVFTDEPLPTGHPFVGLDNILLSPHCSFLTEESLEKMSMTLARGITAALEGRDDPSHATERSLA